MNFKHTISIILLISIRFVTYAQTTLWGGPTDPNSTFSNGLGNWTTLGLNSSDLDSSQNAKWTWSADGTGKTGAYWAGLGINSPTGSTGAAIFNSDFLDNGGSQSNERGGSAPGPHIGVLISPMIDCSNFSSVVLKFNQYFRNYDARCYIDVSTDGGQSWGNRISVNENFSTDQYTSRNDLQLIELASAANHDSVQFRFVFDGDYYFWLIDDVSLISLPDYDLSIESTVYPLRAYKQPISQICNDTLTFSARISNLGAKDQNNVDFNVEIFNSNTNSIYKDSYTSTNIGTTQDNELIKIVKYYLPNQLAIGKYYIVYSVNSSNTDYNTRNNFAVDSFEVSGFQYALESDATSGIRANAGLSYSIGALYETSDCWNANDKFIASSIDMALAANPGANLNGYPVEVNLLKVNTNVLRDFSNFDKTNGELSSSTESLSTSNFVGSTQGNYDEINVSLTDKRTGTKNVALEKGTRYIVMAKHPVEANRNDPNTWKFHASNASIAYPNKLRQAPVIDNTGAWDFFDSNEVPLLRLNIEINTKIDIKKLASNSLELLNNPVTNVLRFKMNFEKEVNANITLFNQDGKILLFQPYKKVNSQIEQIDVQNLVAGLYYIRVSTDSGTKTLSFVKE